MVNGLALSTVHPPPLTYDHDQVIVRTATRFTLKLEANLRQILNLKANFHTEFESLSTKKIMLTMVDTFKIDSIKIK